MSMQKKEAERLSQWLKATGMNTESVIDCFQYIATGRRYPNGNEKEDKK